MSQRRKAVTVPKHPDRYLDPEQAKYRENSDSEDQFAAALEQAFAAGHWELDQLVKELNRTGAAAADASPWTETSLRAHFAALAS
jgi:hypothetical protein